MHLPWYSWNHPMPQHRTIRTLLLLPLLTSWAACLTGEARLDHDEPATTESDPPAGDSPVETDAPPDSEPRDSEPVLDSEPDDSEPDDSEPDDSEPIAPDPVLDCRHRVEVFTGDAPEDIGFRIETNPRQSPRPLIWLAGYISTTPNITVTIEIDLPPALYSAYPFDSEHNGWAGAEYRIVHLATGTLVASGTLVDGLFEAEQPFITTCEAN